MRLAAVALLLGLGLTGAALAQEDATTLESANTNIKNVASLQRGAKYYVNYCLGCHSAKYVRYNRLAADLGITEKQLVDNLMFTGEHPYDTMAIAMKPEDATRWFGVAPPDLSLIARSRGTDYLYTYLRGFYVDPMRPTGVNNIVLRGSAMPAVLWELQGPQRAKFGTDAAGKETFEGFEQIRPGEMPAAQFDEMVRDIVNFLDYIGEPIKREREALGIRVIGFLLVFLLIAYLLKKEIWKDVHESSSSTGLLAAKETSFMTVIANRRSVMTLFSKPADPWSHRTRLVLAEKSISIDIVDVDDGLLPEDLLDLNPYNSVPTLVDRDLVLYDSRVIMEYLDERFPHPPLMPVDPVTRAQFRLALYRIEKDWYSLAEEIGTGVDRKPPGRAVKALEESILSSVEIFSAKKFFLSDEFSLVDCTIAPILWRLPLFNIKLPATARPIQRYMDEVFSRPSFQASLTEFEQELRQ